MKKASVAYFLVMNHLVLCSTFTHTRAAFSDSLCNTHCLFVARAGGDVIGYPALASTSVEQGRRAAVHMWAGGEALSKQLDQDTQGEPDSAQDHAQVKNVADGGFLGRSSESLFPYGIYTIPEISMIGKTEAQLTAEHVPYEVGVSDFTELAKGQSIYPSLGYIICTRYTAYIGSAS